MKCSITGLVVDTVRGRSKDKDYVYSVLLVGRQTVNVFNLDCSSSKRLDTVTVNCNVFPNGESLRVVKAGEGS